MNRSRAAGLEQAIDGGAACFFALCAGMSLFAWGLAPIAVSGGAGLAGAMALALLRQVKPARFEQPFELLAIQYDDSVDDTLLLEDRLPEPAEDSQVVRLFAVGGGARPAHVPGELANRIDHFLGHGRAAPRAAPLQPDAAHELYEALAEIRRTLR